MKTNFNLVMRGQDQKWRENTEKKNVWSRAHFPRGCNVSTLGHCVITQAHPSPCLSQERARLLYGRQKGRLGSQVLVVFASPPCDRGIWRWRWRLGSDMVGSKVIPRLKPLFLYIQPCPLPVSQLDYLLSRDCLNEPCQQEVICWAN